MGLLSPLGARTYIADRDSNREIPIYRDIKGCVYAYIASDVNYNVFGSCARLLRRRPSKARLPSSVRMSINPSTIIRLWNYAELLIIYIN